MFSLLSLLAFLHFRPLSAPETTTGWDWRYYRLATLLFLCALLSKTAVCCLPVVIGVLMWWKLGRITKRDVQVLLPWFAASVIMGLITMRVESPPVEVGATGRPFSIVHGWLQAGRALWFYAGKLFWPSQLTFVYPRWNIDAGTARQNLFPLAALAVVIVLWWLRGRIGKGPLAAVLCFAAMLTPVLGFFDIYFFNFSYVADHFQYMASIGLMALAAGAGATVIQRAGPQGRAFGALVGAVVLLILGVCTWRQAATYHDLETLWRDTLTKNSNAWLAHGNLGVILLREKKDADAQAEFEAALRIKPDYYEAHCNRGLALASQGRSLEAMAEYRETLRLKPDWPPALVSSAWLLATAEDPGIRDGREAVRLAERVCEVTHYRQVDALLALAAAYAEAGRAADAVPIARKVILWVRASGQEKIAAQIEAQLKLYQDGHPDHKGSPYPLLPE
jgi:tetratricopeptide (TPR) repeat protein